jgi:hypothetical protein
MNSGTLKMTGLAGLAWGVLSILVFIIGIVVGVRAVQSGAGAGGAGMIIQILSLLVALSLCWLLFQLSQVFGGGMGAIACYATIAVVVISQIVSLAGIVSGFALILVILQGAGLIAVGVFGLMGARVAGGGYKAFNILLIIYGACVLLAFLVFTLLIAPFLALAAGILLFVAMNGAAKTATA